MAINVFDILNKVYGPKGLPFPSHADTDARGVIAAGFSVENNYTAKRSRTGTPIKKFDSEDLGRYVFLPVSFDGWDMPNPVVIISGEKEIVETNIVNVGTVFEKVFIKPYTISIIGTLVGIDGEWPESELREAIKIWKKDDLVTLKCALTDLFIQSENNYVITNIQLLDAQGAENVEVLQIDGKSNIDFELTIKN
jgi:hypothetical protein